MTISVEAFHSQQTTTIRCANDCNQYCSHLATVDYLFSTHDQLAINIYLTVLPLQIITK